MRELPPLQSLWDYDDPDGSEHRFRDLLPAAASCDRSYHAELITQIARTCSLRRKFDEAHVLLDEADAMIHGEMPRARVRSRLERGRTFNSSGRKDEARALFIEAWELARRHGLDGLAVDAAHMCAIVANAEDAFRWNELGLSLARQSGDPDARRWVGSLCNNLGWSCHALGHYETALRYFQEALKHREQEGKPSDFRIARWCIARCLRSLGRIEEALAMHHQLEAEQKQPNVESDGYVPEEIAECLHALGRTDEARPYFRRAYDILAQQPWLAESEPERLARLKQMGEGATQRSRPSTR
jgi:tetratricopeptide (TPR) repeat protein